MHCLRLYAGPDGESHVEEVVVELHPVEFVPGAPPIGLSAPRPATGVVFASLASGRYDDAHPTPRSLLAVTLAGAVEFTASDGEVRRVGPGVALLMEDTTGKGHTTRSVGATAWAAMVVSLA